MRTKIIFFILVLLSLPLISSDVISINSGGDEEIVITSDKYIEGFFSCVPYTCTGLGYNCGDWGDGCGNIMNCGTCASGYTCSSGTCTVVPVTPGGGGGAGAAGEGPGVVTPAANLEVVPSKLNIRMAVNTSRREILKITNKGTTTQKLSVRQTNLDNKVMFEETSLEIASGETKELGIIFVALEETGIFTGKILIGTKEVLVSLNIKTKLLLFDSNIVVLNKDYRVAKGSKLKTKITLIPLGDEERMDVTLNYVIKNFNGKVFLTQSETVLVEKKIDFKRDFETGDLPLGNYIVGLELVYPGGVAPSSASFEVVKQTPEELIGKIILYFIILILILAIIIIILLIRRRANRNRPA